MIIVAKSKSGSIHRLCGYVKNGEDRPWDSLEQAKAHLTRNGWEFTRVAK